MHHDELNSGGELIPEVEPSVAAQQPSAENRPGLAFKFPERLQAWGRWMLAGNPFYPLSAGWLLYGLFLLNTDARFLGGDNQRLWFTFGSLELYELALVGAGLGLARLALWYDAAMLVILEDLLVLTPFILLSQAVLVDSGEAVIISGLGLALVGVRRWSLRRWFSRLNHPGRLLLMGACLLGVNVALPFIFRIPALQEDSATRAPFAEVVLPLLWNYWLPVVMLVANLLARPTNRGEIEPEKSWLPLVTAGLSVLSKTEGEIRGIIEG